MVISLLNNENVNYVELIMEEYDVPDEHLSYSELKDRVRVECARVLPKKEGILLMAKKLEEDLTSESASALCRLAFTVAALNDLYD